jgi:hypothetical protein
MSDARPRFKARPTEVKCGLVDKWRKDGKGLKQIYAHPQDYSDISQQTRGEMLCECADELESWLRDAAGPLVEAGQALVSDYDRIRVAFAYGLERKVELPSIKLQRAWDAALQRFREGSKQQ